MGGVLVDNLHCLYNFFFQPSIPKLFPFFQGTCQLTRDGHGYSLQIDQLPNRRLFSCIGRHFSHVLVSITVTILVESWLI